MAKKPSALERIQSWDGSGKPGMAKKPKVWRGLEVQGDCRTVQEYPGQRKHYDCLVIPDGATVPLPASVRRVMRAAMRCRRVCTAQEDDWRNALDRLMDAVDAHERATKAKGKS